ncbi:MAG: endolytic transglycosylase MltG [Acidobacteria bacterium]|nr:endolytic transglycosylase MltG [Acidobacteriota bacterium]
MKRSLAIIAVLAVAAAAGIFFTLNRAYKGFPTDQFIEFSKGTGSSEIARRLADAGVIPSRWHLLAVRALRPNQVWQAGEYRFHKSATVWEVADRLRRGDVYLVEFRIPEGYNLYDIAAVVEQNGFAKAPEFIRLARNPALIRDLAPQAPSLEGFLFPSTYMVPRKTSPEALCRLMTEQFRKEWKAAGGGSGGLLSTVTLASLVEKETGAPEERPIVAAVYRNRLGQRMKLEADPTTIYSAMLEGVWRGTIYKSDLQRPHPYNTYAVTGLPPGPIANPGRASLAAALHPAASPFLYFVAKGDGTGRHNFSKTYAEHSRAVIAWRRGRRT